MNTKTICNNQLTGTMTNVTREPNQLEDLIQAIHSLLTLNPDRTKELKSSRTRKELYERALSSEELDATGLAVDKAGMPHS